MELKVVPEIDRLYLPHSTTCFICGANNPLGTKCQFFTNQKGNVFLYTKLNKSYAGYNNIVHGGIQTALLDECMGWCGFTQTNSEVLYFTRELNIKFKRPVTVENNIYIESEIVGKERNFIIIKGKIQDEYGNILTQGSGSFVGIPKEKMEETITDLRFFEDGRKYFKKAISLVRQNINKKI